MGSAYFGLLVACMGACGNDVPAVNGPYFNVAVTCDNFCSTALRRCRGIWRIYTSWEDCQRQCANWPNLPDQDYARGNSLQCRFANVSLVTFVQGTAAYCENAGPSGGQSCRDNNER